MSETSRTIAFFCAITAQAYIGLRLADLAWWLTVRAVRCWRRRCRARAIARRRMRHDDFDWVYSGRLRDSQTRFLWRWRMGITAEQVDAERRRRMRGGIEVPGLP